MSQINESQRGLILGTLMGNKLGPLQFWERPAIADHVGPRDVSHFDRFDQRRKVIVDSCADRLRSFGDDQLLILSSGSLNDPDEIGNEWHGWQQEEIGKLQSSEPSWISVGFGHPDCLADFEYWGQMDTLSLHETLMLSVGMEPKHYEEDRLLKAGKRTRQDELHNTIQFLIRRREIFRRKFPSLHFGYPDVPLIFIREWLDDIEMMIHPEFRAVLDRRTKPNVLSEIEFQQKPIGSQERETLLKMIAAMSCEQYGYDPKADRSEAASRIRDDIAQIGQTMDPKTIRKWLKEASEFVDKDYWS